MGLKGFAYPATFIWTLSSAALSRPVMSRVSVLWPDRLFCHKEPCGYLCSWEPRETTTEVWLWRRTSSYKVERLLIPTCRSKWIDLVKHHHTLCWTVAASVADVMFVACKKWNYGTKYSKVTHCRKIIITEKCAFTWRLCERTLVHESFYSSFVIPLNDMLPVGG